MSIFNITIVGGDLRQCYLAEYLQAQGHIVTCFHTLPFSYKSQIHSAETLSQALKNADLMIGPVPFSKDRQTLFCSNPTSPIYVDELLKLLHSGQTLAGGVIRSEWIAACQQQSVAVIDFMKSDSLTIQNAYLTAEGLLGILIAETDFSLRKADILILGYGNCGFMIGEMLAAMQATVTIFEKEPNRCALAQTRGHTLAAADTLASLLPHFSILINTIPLHLLTEEQLEQTNHDCLIFDIASEPGGFSKDRMAEMQKKLISCPGIPGKYRPQAAGILIGESILPSMQF